MNREARRKAARMKVARPTMDAYEFERRIRAKLAEYIIADETEVQFLTGESKSNPKDYRTALARHYASLIELPEQVA